MGVWGEWGASGGVLLGEKQQVCPEDVTSGILLAPLPLLPALHWLPRIPLLPPCLPTLVRGTQPPVGSMDPLRALHAPSGASLTCLPFGEDCPQKVAWLIRDEKMDGAAEAYIQTTGFCEPVSGEC